MRYAIVLFFALGAALFFAGCSMHMSLNDALRSGSTIYPVKGRQGWLLNQHLSFGPYRSGKVHRGWTESYDIPLVVRFQGAKEKLRFELSDTTAQLRSEVFCVGEVKRNELPVLNDIFRIPLKDVDVFTASVYLPVRRVHWDLALYDSNKMDFGDVSSGVLQNDAGQSIQLREVRRTEKGHSNWGGQPLGYEFVQDDAVIGAVEMLNNGRVLLKNEVPAELRFVLANTAAVLLLKTNLGHQLN